MIFDALSLGPVPDPIGDMPFLAAKLDIVDFCCVTSPLALTSGVRPQQLDSQDPPTIGHGGTIPVLMFHEFSADTI